MDNETGSGNALEEAVIALKYKIFGEDKYKRFKKTMDEAEANGVKSRRVDIKVSVDKDGLNKIKQLQRAMKDIAAKAIAKVDVVAAVAPRVGRSSSKASLTDDFVGPRKPVPINWPSKETPASAKPRILPRAAQSDIGPRATVTVDRIRELGSAARAAAEAVRSAAGRAAASLSTAQQRGAISGAYSSLGGARSRFDPYAADSNLDRAHVAGSFSSLRFNPAAPDMSRMRFSPVDAIKVKRPRIPLPDMTAFKRGIESLRAWSRRAGERIQRNLEITPRIHAAKGVGSLRDAMATVGAGALVGGFASVMNESQQLSDQIKNLTPNINEAAKAQKALLEAAKQTNASYHGTVDIYSSLAAISDKTKLSTDENVNITKTIQMASQLGGGSAEGQKRAIVQLEQALQMGKMDGQGINSIESQSRGLAVVLAQGMGKSMADLKQLTKEGKVTAEEITKAFIKMGPEVEKRFAKVGVTLGGLRNYARTVMLEWASKLSSNWDGWAKGMRVIRDAMAGLNDFMSRAFDKLASVLGGGEQAAKAVQYAFLALGGGAVLAAVWAFGGAVLAALWPVVVAAGAVFAAIVAIDDVIGWMAGKKSVMGDLVGPFEKWKPTFDEIGKSFGELGKAWSDLWGGGDGMKDALNGQSEEPPMVKCFKNMLSAVKDAIEAVKQLLILMTAIRDGQWDVAMHAAASSAASAGSAAWEASPIKNANDSGLIARGARAVWDYSAPGTLARWAGAMGGEPPSAPDKLAATPRGGEGASITTNNSPTVNVYANSDDPAGLAKVVSGEVSKVISAPMLPNAERGPR